MPKFDVYEEVTNQIIEALEQGVKPWECPWQSNAAALLVNVLMYLEMRASRQIS